VLDDPSVDKLYIVMEYVKNGSLMSKLSKNKAMPPNIIWKYFRDIISGIHYLHECVGVIHRDIKPENLLIDENDRVKISDFGVSFILENGCDEIQSTAGSNYFFSPEICAGQTYKGKKSDIWALGVTLYFLIFRRYPFTSSNIPQLYSKILSADEPSFLAPGDPPNPLLIDLLRRMLAKNPEERLSIQEVLAHDWVTANGIQPILIHHYPPIEISEREGQEAIGKVSMIANIRIRMKKKIEEGLILTK
jgi:serine/threonine protein kinase